FAPERLASAAPCGSGRSTSFIPAVPAALSVTTIAFIAHLPVSSSRLLGSRSILCPRTGYRTETDRSKSWPRPPRCEKRNGRAMSVSWELSPRVAPFVFLLLLFVGLYFSGLRSNGRMTSREQVPCHAADCSKAPKGRTFSEPGRENPAYERS